MSSWGGGVVSSHASSHQKIGGLFTPMNLTLGWNLWNFSLDIQKETFCVKLDGKF